jgi:hypothetical protein
MVSLVSGLTTRAAPAFFLSVLRRLGRVLRGRLRGIAGMSIKSGLQLGDPLLQLGNSSQGLAQGILQEQDVSLHLWWEFLPSLWSNWPCFHKTLNTLFFKKSRVFFIIFQKILPQLQLGD